MYTLIQGEFSKEEAKEIIHSIFSEKIKFHEMKNFSSLERTGKEHFTAKTRISELGAEMNKIKEFIDKTEPTTSSLSISAKIDIQEVK
jgi:hypothetical protein